MLSLIQRVPLYRQGPLYAVSYTEGAFIQTGSTVCCLLYRGCLYIEVNTGSTVGGSYTEVPLYRGLPIMSLI